MMLSNPSSRNDHMVAGSAVSDGIGDRFTETMKTCLGRKKESRSASSLCLTTGNALQWRSLELFSNPRFEIRASGLRTLLPTWAGSVYSPSDVPFLALCIWAVNTGSADLSSAIFVSLDRPHYGGSVLSTDRWCNMSMQS